MVACELLPSDRAGLIAVEKALGEPMEEGESTVMFNAILHGFLGCAVVLANAFFCNRRNVGHAIGTPSKILLVNL